MPNNGRPRPRPSARKMEGEDQKLDPNPRQIFPNVPSGGRGNHVGADWGKYLGARDLIWTLFHLSVIPLSRATDA